MYRVIIMYGVDEPWWFFEDWKKDIVQVEEFHDFYKALKYYKREWLKMARLFEEYKSQEDLLSAFWEPGDKIWCEECVAYQQRYHSLALLEDWHQIPVDKKRWAYEKRTGIAPHKHCNKKINKDENVHRDY